MPTEDGASGDATDASTAPEPPAQGEQQSQTFTQADVDRIVQERLKRAESKYADYADLKAKASKLDEIEAANQSELEKATKKAADAEARLQALEAAARAATVKSAVTLAATKADAVDPDAVLALLPSDSVTVGDDGQVTGADDAVKALLKEKPYLVGKPAPRPGGADGGARSTSGAPLTADALRKMTAEQVAALPPDTVAAALAAG